MKITGLVIMAALALSAAVPAAYAEIDSCSGYIQKQQFDEAIRACTRQITGEIRVENPVNAYINRGVAYNNTGRFDLAVADFARSIELDPKSAPAFYNRGFAYANKGLYDLAIADYTVAIDDLSLKRGMTYSYRGQAYFETGQHDRAIADFTRTIELDSKYTYGYYNRGMIYENKGLFGQAIADYSKAIELEPKDEFGYLRLLIATWLAKGDASGPLDRLRKHVASVNNSDESLRNRWLRPVSRFYLGKMSEKSVLAEARKGKDDKEVNQRLCIAYYYIGVKHLVAGKRQEAARYLARSIATEYTQFDEFNLAKLLLERMKKENL